MDYGLYVLSSILFYDVDIFHTKCESGPIANPSIGRFLICLYTFMVYLWNIYRILAPYHYILSDIHGQFLIWLTFQSNINFHYQFSIIISLVIWYVQWIIILKAQSKIIVAAVRKHLLYHAYIHICWSIDCFAWFRDFTGDIQISDGN